jgi:hexosaminidase
MPMKYLLFLSVAASLVGCSPEPDPIHVVPKPATIKQGTRTLTVNQDLHIVASTEDEKNVASLFQGYLKAVAIEVSVSEQRSPDKTNLLLKTEAGSGKESYSLLVNGDGIEIKASDGAGLFYGAQTFMQLVWPEKTGVISYPYVEIDDAPRFPYRGLHLDVGRHMFPVEYIKKYIDLMARHKFNRFHWHLTEDQGWRIEIKKYPKLQEVAAYRNQTVIGKASTKNRPTDPGRYDKTRYGGFYTQEEVKEVVAYAAERYITVVPEIELPGHALAALTAYPNLGCTGGPYKVAETWGIFDDVFCAGKEDAFLFLQDVFDEIIPLFPGEYIHVGGDECPKAEWKKCPHCQKRIKTEKLKDEHELQSYFIQRMEKYLNSKGKKIIGWDEILEGGLAPGATVMSWRGEEGGIEAAKQNHDVVMTPTKWCYFDYYQDSLKSDPLATGLYLPVKQVYSYEPEPPQLNAEEVKHILGVQANVWTEYIKDTDYLEYMVYPRACAMAEVAWSSKEARDYNDFLIRMSTHMKRLDAWDVNYAKHIVNDIPKGSK